MEGMNNNGIGLGDAMLLAQNGGGGFGNGGAWFLWIIVLFFLIGGNGSGFGNGGQMAADLAAAKTQANIWQSNDAQSMENSIRDVARQINQVGDGIASSFVALNGQLNNGFTNAMRDSFGLQSAIMGGCNNLAQAVAENRYAAQTCCCETNRNIDSVRYDAALNTAGINSTATANTQKILDKLCSMEAAAKDAEIANLRQQLSAVGLAASQQAQNAALVQAIRPYPNPAYIVNSPYGTGCTCGA